MRLLRKITLKKEDGSYDGVEVELDFPELLGMQPSEEIVAKLRALGDTIRAGLTEAPRNAAPAPARPAEAKAPPAATESGQLPSLLPSLLAKVQLAKTRTELDALKGELAGLPHDEATKVRAAARARWIKIGG